MARRATSETMKMLPEAGPRPFDPGIFQAGAAFISPTGVPWCLFTGSVAGLV